MKLRKMRKQYYLSWVKMGRMVDNSFVCDKIVYRFYKTGS